MKKFIPQNIKELLDERIEFCKSVPILERELIALNYHKSMLLYITHPDHQNEIHVKNKFKGDMVRYIVELGFGIEHQLQGYTPTEHKDYLNNLKNALCRIFDDVNNL